MKKIIAGLLAVLMSGIPSAYAEISATYLNQYENVKFNITLPDSCINDYYTLYVLNPGKSIEDLSVLDSSTVLHYAQGEYKEGGIEVNFKLNQSKYNSFTDYHFPVVVRSGDVTEEFEFSGYPEVILTELLQQINLSDRTNIDTLADSAADAFNVTDFEEYSIVSDKEKIAEKLFVLADEETADGNNISTLLKKAVILAGVESGEISLLSQDGIKNNNIIGISDNASALVTEINDINACEEKVLGSNFNTIAQLNEMLTQAIFTSAIYDNTMLGYSHIDKIISGNSDYFVSKGLNLTNYNASQKDVVGQNLLVGGEKDLTGMIQALNSLSVSSEYVSSGTSSGGSSSSSGGSSTIGIIPVTSNKNPSSTEEAFAFEDIDSVSWAKAKINALTENGVIAKSEDKMFYPMRSITRAEFVKLVVEALSITADSETSFGDVNSSDWYASYIRRGVGAGIIFGDGENFKPNDNIKRQDIAAILKRALEYKGVNIKNTGYLMSFTDSKDISDYAKESVEILYQYGIISGTDTNEFLPQNNATRAEAAVMIYGVMMGAKNGLLPKYVKKESDSNKNEEYPVAKETEMLVRIGILPVEFASDIQRNIKRSEFAKITASFVGKSELSSFSDAGIYADVNENTDYAGYINNMTTYGYLSAKEEDLYKPNDYISGIDAIVMVMKALGYGKAFSTEAEFLSEASVIGVSKSVPQAQTPITVADLVKLFNNTLDVNVMNATIAGDKVSMEKGQTFLETYHDVILKKGVVNGNSITNYYTNITPKKNTILLDSEEFYVSDSLYYISDYLGYYIEIAYIEDTKEIVSFETLRNDELVISDEDLLSYSGTRLTYMTDEGKEKSITIPKDAIFIYNGAVLGEYTSEIFDIDSGSVELVGANGGEYNIVKIYDYDTIISNGATEQKIYAYGTNDEYDLERYDNVIIRGVNGTLKEISDIKTYDVLSVAESYDHKQIIFIIGLPAIEGTISNIVTSDRTCQINGTEYQFIPDSGINHTMSLNSGTFFIDFKGRIAYAKVKGQDTWRYGYLVKAVYDDVGNFVFKILNEDGDLEVVEQPAEVEVDGMKTTNEQIYHSFCYNEMGEATNEFYPQLIKYKQKNDGTITIIDTSYKSEVENETTLSVNRDVYNEKRIYGKDANRLAEHREINSPGYIENQMLLDDNTVIFAVPLPELASDAQEEDYIVYNKDYFENRSGSVYGPVWAYDTDFTNGALVKALVIPSNQSESKLNVKQMFLVYDAGVTINENNEEVGYVEGYDFPSESYKTMTSYEKENLFTHLKAGDVIRYGLDEDGYVCAINHDLDYKTAKIGQFIHPQDHDNGGWNTGTPEFACYYGILTHKEGKYITFSKEIKEINGEIARGNIVYDCSDAVVFKFDKDTQKITELTPEELSAYVYTQNSKARVYVYSKTAMLKSVIIYE